MLFKSLKLQLLIYFILANIIIFSGFSVYIYTIAQKGVSNNLDTMLKIVSIDAVPDLKTNKNVSALDVANELMEEFFIEPLIVKIIYYNKKTNTVDSNSISSAKYNELFYIPLHSSSKINDAYYFDRGEYRVSSMALFEDADTIIFFQLATTKIMESAYLDKLFFSLLIANPIILIILTFLANILINRAMNPVKEVITSVKNISSDKLDKRISIEGLSTEIKNLVQTFNTLLESLEESFHRIATFSSDASHELKTPLTVIRGEIEVALRHVRTQEEYTQVLQNVLQETVYVQETIEQLFFITKKDTAELCTNFKEIYLDELISDVVEKADKMAQTKPIYIHIKEIIPLSIEANETLLKTALSNILQNAILYSHPLSTVEILLKEEKNHYLLSIEDNGCGISEENLPFIFDRFYRVSKSRSRKDGGTGLGLAIVKMIMDIHNFTVEVQSTLNKGTKFIIKITKS